MATSSTIMTCNFTPYTPAKSVLPRNSTSTFAVATHHDQRHLRGLQWNHNATKNKRNVVVYASGVPPEDVKAPGTSDDDDNPFVEQIVDNARQIFSTNFAPWMKFKGMPDHLRSIEIKLGGKWRNFYPEGMVYHEGWVRYMHNVNPQDLSPGELFLAAQMMFLEPNLPTRMWYHAYGADIPEGLRPITNAEDLAAMFANCAEHGMWMARVYMQDVEFLHFNNALGQKCVSYIIPQEIPPVPRRFDALDVHTDAMVWHEMLTSFEDSELKKQEAFGDRWYLDTNKYPKFPLPRERYATFRNRDTERFMMGLKNPYWGRYRLKAGTFLDGINEGQGVVMVPKIRIEG